MFTHYCFVTTIRTVVMISPFLENYIKNVACSAYVHMHLSKYQKVSLNEKKRAGDELCRTGIHKL